MEGPRPPIVIYASHLAGLAGLHRYRDQMQAVVDQWWSTDPAGCCEYLDAHASNFNFDSHVLDAEQHREFETACKLAIDAPNGRTFETVLASVSNADVREKVREESSKVRGCRGEDAALTEVERKYDVAVTNRNDQLYTRELVWPASPDGVGAPTNRKVVIVGRIDGIAGSQLTEVKNRMRGFFRSVPLYEQVQVQTYMWLTGKPSCLFVQRFDGQIREEVLEFDAHFWQHTVLCGLADGVRKLERLLSGENLHDTLQSGVLPEKYVRARAA